MADPTGGWSGGCCCSGWTGGNDGSFPSNLNRSRYALHRRRGGSACPLAAAERLGFTTVINESTLYICQRLCCLANCEVRQCEDYFEYSYWIVDSDFWMWYMIWFLLHLEDPSVALDLWDVGYVWTNIPMLRWGTAIWTVAMMYDLWLWPKSWCRHMMFVGV